MIVTEVGSKTDGVLTFFLAKFMRYLITTERNLFCFMLYDRMHGDRIYGFFPSVLCGFVVIPQVCFCKHIHKVISERLNVT